MSKLKKSEQELGNDELLAKVEEHKKAIQVLLSKIKAIPEPERPSLAQCNKAARSQREAKFAEKSRIKSAVEMALSRDSGVKSAGATQQKK